MKPEINTETAETVQTGGSPAVVQERLVRPFVECPRCQGKGNVLMGSELWETLQVVSKMKGEFCAEDVAAKIVGVHPTTMNNRMATLLEMELIEFTVKDGKRKMFRFRWPNAESIRAATNL